MGWRPGPRTEPNVWKPSQIDPTGVRRAMINHPLSAGQAAPSGQEVPFVTGRILVGVDGSEASGRALAWAIEEAAVHGSVVEAIIVWQSPYDVPRDFYFPVDERKLVDRARAALADVVDDAAGAHPPVEIEPLVVEGDPAGVLCRRSAEADMVVVGSRGHGQFTDMLLGSVSSKCAHHSRSPVVIVPTPHRGDRTRGLQPTGRIVVGVDGSPGSLKALRWALDEAEARRATVEALMVRRRVELAHDTAADLATSSPPVPHDTGPAQKVTDSLRRVVSEARGESGVGVEPVVAEGDPAETLCQHSSQADLLVLGSRGHGTFTELLLGSVSTKCAHHSSRPVVIVPTAGGVHAPAPQTSP